MINDTARQKVESSNDIAINANDYYILELYGWNGSYKYNKSKRVDILGNFNKVMV